MRRLADSHTVLTTVCSPTPKTEAAAAVIAKAIGRPFVARQKDTIRTLTSRAGARAALVVDSDDVRLVYDGTVYRFHPNMAHHRVVALTGGRGDRFVTVAGLRPGDSVLDCTCGLGADAIVAACTVGTDGAVVALEASRLLAAVVRHGLGHYTGGSATLVRAMRRVTVVAGRYETFLPRLPPASIDVVYFDPMFASTIDGAKGLELVRLTGSHGAPSRAALAEAQRVARRCVVVKDRAPGRLLASLGVPVVSKSRSTWFGRTDRAARRPPSRSQAR